MATSYDQVHLAKAVITYMGLIPMQKSSRQDKNIARSPELKSFLMYLSAKAPSIMDKVLKAVSRKCEDALVVEKALRVKKNSLRGTKRIEPPNCNQSNAKRLKFACAAEKSTARQMVVHDEGEVPVKYEKVNVQPDRQSSKMVSPPISTLEEDEDSRVGHKEKEVPGMEHKEDRPSSGAVTCVSDPPLDDEEDTPMEDGTPSAQCEPESSETCVPQTPNSTSGMDEESRDEMPEKEAPRATAAENRPSSVAVARVNDRKVEEMAALPTAYEIESGLSSGSPIMENYVKASLFALGHSTTRPNFSVHTEVARVWKIILLLDFFKTRRDLHQYLENREKMPGEKSQARITWKSTNPGEILDTLDSVQRNSVDNKIHRAYGQMMLFSSVNARIATGYESTVGRHLFDHTALLEELARKKAGPVSKKEVDQVIASYLKEYFAGQRWLAVTNWFGGSGIVLVFVTAGIGSWYVEGGWTEFQRGCVQHIAGLLLSIRGLVDALGSDALEYYCRHGCLGSDCVDRVKLASFTRPDKDEGSEDTDDGSEDGDEDSEDGDGDVEDADRDAEGADRDVEDGDEGSEDGDEEVEDEDEGAEDADGEYEDDSAQ